MLGGEGKNDSCCRRNEADRYSGISDMRRKEERVHEPCFSDRSHVMLPDMSNLRAYQKMIQEPMMTDNNVPR